MATLVTLENLATFLTQCDARYYRTTDGSLLSTEQATKLEGIATGAEVNVIDEVQVNGSALPVSDKAVNIDLSNYALRSEIVQGVVYRGSVETYSALPASPETGDIYQVQTADAEHDIEAGEFVIYDGTAWQDLGGTLDVDLSNYYTKTEADGLFQTIAGLEDAVEGLGFVKADEVSGEIDLSAYLTIESASATYQTIAGMSSYVTSESLTSTLAGYMDTASNPSATDEQITALFS